MCVCMFGVLTAFSYAWIGDFQIREHFFFNCIEQISLCPQIPFYYKSLLPNSFLFVYFSPSHITEFLEAVVNGFLFPLLMSKRSSSSDSHAWYSFFYVWSSMLMRTSISFACMFVWVEYFISNIFVLFLAPNLTLFFFLNLASGLQIASCMLPTFSVTSWIYFLIFFTYPFPFWNHQSFLLIKLVLWQSHSCVQCVMIALTPPSLARPYLICFLLVSFSHSFLLIWFVCLWIFLCFLHSPGIGTIHWSLVCSSLDPQLKTMASLLPDSISNYSSSVRGRFPWVTLLSLWSH